MPGEIAWCDNPMHAHKESSCEARRAPLWMLRFHPRAVRVRVRDWLWLRRHRNAGYAVELGGQRFTQAQWEAVQVYVEGTSAPTQQVDERCRCSHARGVHARGPCSACECMWWGQA